MTTQNTNAVVINNFIEELKAVKGTNKKKDFINDFISSSSSNRKALKVFLECVYSKVNLYQTEINQTLSQPTIFEDAIQPTMSWYGAYINFILGEKRGQLGEKALSFNYNSCFTEHDKQLLEYIVQGEVKCGIGPATWNKIFETELIYIPRYQRCSKLSDKNYENWKYIIVQTKEDAQFVNIKTTSDGVEFYTRNWNLIDTESLKPLAEKIHKEYPMGGFTVMGEIYVTDPTGVRYGREKSNGMISGIVATAEPLPEGCGFDFVLWDLIPNIDFDNKRCEIPYYKRLLQTVSFEHIMKNLSGIKSSVIKSDAVDNIKEVSGIFYDIVNSKGEGVVIKNPMGIWEHHDGGHKDISKIKLPMNVKMRIVSFNEAEKTSRHANTFASVNIQSECGKIVTAMSGMKDSVRTAMNNDRESYVNKIVEVKCNGIQYNPEEPHSLYYANYLCERDDVDVAQNFDDIVKVMQSAVEAIAMI